MDAEWDSDMDARYTNDLAEGFVDWKDRIYNVGITKLMKDFMENLRNGKVLGILKEFYVGQEVMPLMLQQEGILIVVQLLLSLTQLQI